MGTFHIWSSTLPICRNESTKNVSFFMPSKILTYSKLAGHGKLINSYWGENKLKKWLLEREKKKNCRDAFSRDYRKWSLDSSDFF